MTEANTDPPTKADDADTVDGKHANEIGGHLEGKKVNNANRTVSASWTTAFNSTPAVTATANDSATTYGVMAHLTSVSTTGATAARTTDAGNDSDAATFFTAMEQT